MAVTFDTAGSTIDSVVYYKQATTTATLRTGSAFSYFDNDFGVGDIVYFMRTNGCWHELVVNVGTAIAATSYTLVWEVYDGSAWASLTVTDGTNGFSNLGTNTVSFTPPKWAGVTTGPSSTRGYAIRARITAVNTPTNGGANVTTRPTYSNYEITVTGTGNRISTLQTANDAGGWGMMTTTNGYTNCLCNIYIGNSSTTSDLLIKSNEYLEIGTSALTGRIVRTTTNGTLQVGETSSGNYFGTSMIKQWSSFNGVYVNYNGPIKVYNSSLIWNNGVYWQTATGCVLDLVNSVIANDNSGGSGLYISSGTTGSLKNVTVETGSAYLLIYSNITVDNLIFARCAGVLVGANSVIIQNTDFLTSKIFNIGNPNVSSIARNCKFSDFNAQTSCGSTGDIARIEYSLTLNLLNERNATLTGAKVLVKNALGTTLFNGTWTADLNIEVFKKSYGPVTETYNPIEIWVSKDGYESVYKKITLTYNNRVQEIKLKHAVSPGRDNMGDEYK